MNRSRVNLIFVAALGLSVVGYHWATSPKSSDKPALTLVNPTGVGCIVFSPDGRLIGTVDQQHPAKIRDVTTGKVVSQLKNSREAYDLTFVSQGKTVVGRCNAGAVGVWDVATGRQKVIVKGHPGRVPERMNAYDPVAEKFFSIPSTRTTFASIDCMDISRDEKLLATGSNDKTIEVWSVTRGKRPQIFKEHKSSVRSVAFSPDGKTIASSDEKGVVKVWDPLTGKVTRAFNSGTGFTVEWSSDGKELSIWSGEGKTSVWDARTFSLKKTVNSEAGRPSSIESHPTQILGGSTDGSRYAVCDDGYGLNHQSRPYANIYDKRGANLYTFRIAQPYTCAFSPDGKLFAVGGVEYQSSGPREVIQIWKTP